MDQVQGGVFGPSGLIAIFNVGIILAFAVASIYLFVHWIVALKAIAELPTLLERVAEKLGRIDSKLDRVIDSDSSRAEDDGSLRVD